MPTDVSQKLYTIEEFLALSLSGDENDGDTIQYELVRGEIGARPRSGTSGEHGRIVARLGHFLDTYADEHNLGRVYTQASCTLGRPEGSNWVEPDISFVATGRTLAHFSGSIPVAPDLVIEVNSPGDTIERIHNKLEAYRETNVRLIWSIYMLEKYIVIYRLNDPDVRFLNINGELEGQRFCPVLSCP